MRHKKFIFWVLVGFFCCCCSQKSLAMGHAIQMNKVIVSPKSKTSQHSLPAHGEQNNTVEIKQLAADNVGISSNDSLVQQHVDSISQFMIISEHVDENPEEAESRRSLYSPKKNQDSRYLATNLAKKNRPKNATSNQPLPPQTVLAVATEDQKQQETKIHLELTLPQSDPIVIAQDTDIIERPCRCKWFCWCKCCIIAGFSSGLALLALYVRY